MIATEQKYRIYIQTPLGKRRGEMSAIRDGSQIKGFLSVLNNTQPFKGTIDREGSCSISGVLVTLMNRIPYTAEGLINEHFVSLIMQSEKHRFVLSGSAMSGGDEG